MDAFLVSLAATGDVTWSEARRHQLHQKRRSLRSSDGKGRFDIEIKDFYGLFMGRMLDEGKACGACEFLSPRGHGNDTSMGLVSVDLERQSTKKNQVDML